jgi:Tol biopolymer transport system component
MYDGDIWTVDVPSGALRKWTDNAPDCHWPTWSPDGRYILYCVIGRPAFAPDSVAGLHLIDTRDGTQRALVRDSVLAKYGGGIAQWSPDGSRIAYFTWVGAQRDPSQLQSDLIVISSDGVSWGRIITVSGTAQHPHWSSDGQKLFFDLTPSPLLPGDTGATTTWVVNLDGTGLRKWPVNLGDPRVTFAFPFQLDQSGLRVAFVGLDATGKRGVIWTMNLSGTNRKQLTRP